MIVGIPGLAVAGLMLLVREPKRQERRKGDHPLPDMAETFAFFRARAGILFAIVTGFGVNAIISYGLSAWVPSLFYPRPPLERRGHRLCLWRDPADFGMRRHSLPRWLAGRPDDHFGKAGWRLARFASGNGGRHSGSAIRRPRLLASLGACRPRLDQLSWACRPA
jgi:hypothetical protein